MIIKHTYSSRDEWLKLRKGYIGGSDAAAVVGLNPYSSPYSLWAEKTGRVPGFDGNLTTEVGAYLEDFVAKLFEKKTGKKVKRQNAMLVNDDYPWACADVDRVVMGEDAILEIKTTNSLGKIRKLKHGEIPEQFFCQMMHYLAVTGKKTAYLAVLIESREFKWFPVERDEDEINALMAMEKSFWELVKADTPPAAIGIEADTETLQTLYPEGNGGYVDLFGYGNMLEAYEALGKRIKELQKEQESYIQQIKQVMGEAETGRVDGWKVSWKTSTRRTLDKAALESVVPGGLERFTKESTCRVFKVTRGS